MLGASKGDTRKFYYSSIWDPPNEGYLILLQPQHWEYPRLGAQVSGCPAKRARVWPVAGKGMV